MKNFEAVVFDMDGVIFDSERITLGIWKALGEKYNIPNIEENCRKCLGVNLQKATQIMLDAYGPDFEYAKYREETSKTFHDTYDGGKLPMKTGVVELLTFLKDNNKKTALASSTKEQTVKMQLRDAGIIDFFEVIVCGDMVEKSKPEPDIFLRACELLKVEPKNAYAIEDSYNGIRSSSSAGMMPIMVPDMAEPTAEMEKLAVEVLPSLLAVKEYFMK